MYCRNCRYPLKGLESEACPECGHSFSPDDPTSYTTTPQSFHWINTAVGFALLIFVLIWALRSGGDIFIFLDVYSIIFMVFVMAAGMCISFGPRITYKAIWAAAFSDNSLGRDECALYLLVFARAYQLAWAAGIVGMLLSLITILQHMDDPSKIGPGIAYSLLTVFYGAILAEFIIAPLQQVIATRSGLSASNLPLLVMPQRTIVGFVMAVVFGIVAFVLCLYLGLLPV